MSSKQASAAADPNIVIDVQDVSKLYAIYTRPENRLKQMILGRFTQRKWFSEHWALRNITFSMKRGEAVGIVGPNGAGKSTLLQLITGIIAPTSGNITTMGRVAALLELGAGFNPEFTGRENAFLSASLLGLSQEEIEDRIDDIEAFADIGLFMDHPVKLYSSGMYARLAFAVAAHVDADVLIVDEILSVGDIAFNQKCMRFIKRFKEQGTLLFVTHDTAAVANLCDNALWIDHGQMQEIGDAKTVSEAYMASIFGSKTNRKSEQEQPPEEQKQESTPQELPENAPEPEQHAQEEQGVFCQLKRRSYSDVREDTFKRYLPEAYVEFFQFDDGYSFGHGGANITDVRMEDEDGNTIATAEGGQQLKLVVQAEVHERLDNPFMGFLVRDRLGQNLFGDNTFLSTMGQDLTTPAGSTLQAEFLFELPHLPPGDYAVTAAISDGTQLQHVHHHWVYDAFLFRVHASRVEVCLFGVPMREIQVRQMPAKAMTEG